jgi:hypothetical protein
VHVIELFISAHCPGSPEASRALRVFCGQHGDVHLIEREVESAMDLAGQYGLFATPATVIDGHHVLYGVPSAERLKRYLRADCSPA